jgi:translation elongation factor P/translation initiation factor 5A
MKEASEFRAGNIIKSGNDLLLVLKAEYNKGARSASTMKLKTKNLEVGSIAETVYRATDKLDEVRLDRRKMQFSYKNGDMFVFMDQATYETCIILKRRMLLTSFCTTKNRSASSFRLRWILLSSIPSLQFRVIPAARFLRTQGWRPVL